MEQFERIFRKRFYAVVGCGACVLLALAWLSIKGALSPREFGIAVLLWWIAMFAAVFPLIRARQRSAEGLRKKQINDGISVDVLDRDRYVKNIRSMRTLAALFTFLLIYGILATQGEPMLPRAAGAAFDAFLMAACVFSILRSRRRLKELAAGSAKAESETN